MADTSVIALVDYLELEPVPRLVVHECTACGARFFDRRNGCASCSGRDFRRTGLPPEGTLKFYTIVHVGPAGVDVPFVAAVVDCGGTSVRSTLVNVDARPELITPGMPVRMTTFDLGRDSDGVQAVGFGFEPSEAETNDE